MLFDRRHGMKIITGVHEFWYRLTGGLIGGNVFGTKVLLLTTSGRKSGRRYTTPLTYLEDGDNLIVVASNGGADTDPDWWRNLNANSQAFVQIGAEHRELHAEAAAGDERGRLWSAVTTRYPLYRRYERATKRQIPVVVLRPTPVASNGNSKRQPEAAGVGVASDDASSEQTEAPSTVASQEAPALQDELSSAANDE